MRTFFKTLSCISVGLLCTSSALASAPFPETRPDRAYSSELQGVWRGKLTVGSPSPTCKNTVGVPKRLTLNMCITTDSDDGQDTVTGRARFKRRYKLLQRNASYRRIFRRNRLRTSIATNGSDSEAATSILIYFQRRLNNDNSRHGNIYASFVEETTDLYTAGDLVVTLGNCISGVLTKVSPGSC